MTVFRILIFCVRLAGDLARSWLCCLTFLIVISFWSFHLRDGVRLTPRYVYDSFWVKIGKFWEL